MKKLLFLMMFSGTILFACSSKDQAAEDRQDSINAATKADSMLQAELAADSVKTDSAKVDSVKK
ncbi:MAG TPA: hypothetical protein DIT07_04195 [Sphingobacteriaceae bacterium]|nr:hypothetical protein [Sphingobacteriaceae bacterium]